MHWKELESKQECTTGHHTQGERRVGTGVATISSCTPTIIHYITTWLYYIRWSPHTVRKRGTDIATTSSYTPTLLDHISTLYYIWWSPAKVTERGDGVATTSCATLLSIALTTSYIELQGWEGEVVGKPQKKNRHQTVRGFCQTKATAEHFI